jgi:hypothetical protein
MSAVVQSLTFNRDKPLSNALESLIQQANRHQQSERTLKLCAHRFALQPNYWLGIENNHAFENNLVLLITQYAEYLPVLVDEFNEQCDTINWHPVAEKANHIVSSFFEKLESPLGQVGLLALLDKIYFSHRLIEELHDHMMVHTCGPITAWNMTAANLLVHQLLGSEYSSRLDQSAIELSQKILSSAPEPKKSEHKKSQAYTWPCFCERHGMSLAF